MVANLQVDIRKMLEGSRFYCCTVGMALSLLLNGTGYLKTHPNGGTLTDCFNTVVDDGFILMFYLLCVVAGGLDFCVEYKNHYMKYNVIRGGVSSYARSKTLTAAFGGFISMFLAFLIYEIFMSAALTIRNGAERSIFSSTEALIENVWYVLIFCLLGMVLSVLAVFITTCIPNVFVGLMMPILIYYLVIAISTKHCNIWTLMPSCIYFGYYKLFGSHPLHFLYACLFSSCIIWLLYKGILWQLKRRMQNV